jgi:hypothetical protein
MRYVPSECDRGSFGFGRVLEFYAFRSLGGGGFVNGFGESSHGIKEDEDYGNGCHPAKKL